MEKKHILLLSLFILASDVFAAEVGINGCADLDTQGTKYVLTSDILNSSAMECLRILANDVTLDCRGHLVEGMNLSDTFGIIVNGVSRATVKNCVASDWFFGVTSTEGGYNTFINITSDSSKMWGFTFNNGRNNTARNVTVAGTASYGFVLLEASKSFIQDVRVTGGGNFGFDVWNSSNNTIYDVTSTDNENDGFILDNSHYNVLHDLVSLDNEGEGYYLYYSSGNTFNNARAEGNNDSGFFLYYSMENTIDNATCAANGQEGFYLLYSNDNTIKNSRSTMNTVAGMLLGSSQHNSIYNSLFNNTEYATIIDGVGYDNTWNTTRQTGSRISSTGTQIGGNFWAAPPGDGYSEVCEDADTNGFCDMGYELAKDNIDYLPLSNKYVGCALAGDDHPCGQVTLSEVIALINKWSVGQATLQQVIALINAWATG